MEKVYQQHWIDLPREIRARLAEIFGIEKTGITEVRDQTVISDGTTNTDLQAITLEKMEAYTGQKGSFAHLWETTINQVFQEFVSLTDAKEQSDQEIINIEILEELKEETKDEPIKEAKKSK